MNLLDAYFLVFDGLDRQGPGSVRSTRKALSLLPDPLIDGVILDAGCGTGASTIPLASTLQRPILASDVNQRSLDCVKRRAEAAGVGALIDTRLASMDDLGAEPDSAALIWSEGAVFTVGVANALKHWRPLLKSGGFVAYTEMTWIGPDRPEEAVAFLQTVYPPMTDIAGNLAIAHACGYREEALFVLPAADWWDEYLAGIKERIPQFRAHPDETIASVLAVCEREMEVFRRCSDSYGYVFYILSKSGT